ncbi:prepilin-type N-terminal cleavage/methylation domain-containing protein [Patescibacteria group bacterium]
MFLKNSGNKGFSIIEIIVVIFVLAVAFTGILTLITFALSISSITKENTQAVNIAQETAEAVRNFRDGTNWNSDGLGTKTIGISHYPQKIGGPPPSWTLVQGEEVVNGYTRKVVFEDVFRDTNDDIVELGGALDSDTIKAVITVSWEDKEVEIETYFTNWK